jgi:ABC-type antimicrobial peptide transport system permease subunit
MYAGVGLISTLRMPLLKGRDFRTSDRAGAPLVVIVNQRLASLCWPGEDPVGKRIPLPSDTEADVVGLVGNSKYLRVGEDALPILYEAFDQMRVMSGMLQIRGHGDLRDIERDVRRIAKATAPNYLVRSAYALEVLRDGTLSQERVLSFLSSLFGVVGTGLALVGIYGLISYAVTRRTREVGIRMSVGAQRRDVLWLFLRESLALTAAGIALGLPLGLALARLIGTMLYGVSTREPVDVALTIAALAAGGAAAAYLPGRRATRIDPVRALRYD